LIHKSGSLRLELFGQIVNLLVLLPVLIFKTLHW